MPAAANHAMMDHRAAAALRPEEERMSGTRDDLSAHEAAGQRFNSFAEFYPFYLSEHRDRTCRRLHFVGTSAGVVAIVLALVTLNPWWLLAGLFVGYLFTWIGHFGFEKNRPSTFKYPFYSFIGDWAMYRDIWRGRIPF
jgi:hypothetical protein